MVRLSGASSWRCCFANVTTVRANRYIVKYTPVSVWQRVALPMAWSSAADLGQPVGAIRRSPPEPAAVQKARTIIHAILPLSGTAGNAGGLSARVNVARAALERKFAL